MTAAARPVLARPTPGRSGAGRSPSIWLVFLVFPITAVVESDVARSRARSAVRLHRRASRSPTCSATPSGRSTPWWALGLMVALRAGDVPVIGIDAVSYTPYLAILSALELPRPAVEVDGRRSGRSRPAAVAAAASTASRPTSSSCSGRSCSAASMLRHLRRARAAGATPPAASYALVAERERVARDVHDVLGPLADRAVGQGRARRPAHRRRPRARQGGAGVDPGDRAPGARRGAGDGRRPARAATSRPSSPPRRGCSTTPASARRVVGAVADTDPRHRALLAWVLRESVTNVVRHARARRRS